MAANDEKGSPGRADVVRNAAVQAFQATAGQAGISRERAQELADELAHAAARVRGAIDELRPVTAEEIRSVREELHALERRVEALEAAAAPAARKAVHAESAARVGTKTSRRLRMVRLRVEVADATPRLLRRRAGVVSKFQARRRPSTSAFEYRRFGADMSASIGAGPNDELTRRSRRPSKPNKVLRNTAGSVRETPVS
jgi:polyhydroxyalkanoate synthesis regulator phasin